MGAFSNGGGAWVHPEITAFNIVRMKFLTFNAIDTQVAKSSDAFRRSTLVH